MMKDKVMGFLRSKEAKVGTFVSGLSSAMVIAASAEGETTAAIDVSGITTALSSAVSVTDIVTVLAAGIGIAIGFALMWFGVRKVVTMFMSALQKGKVKV